MGKKDKKDAGKVEAKKARQALKQQKNDVKRSKKEIRDGNEVDIDAIIADFVAKEAKKTAVSVTICEQPSRRANFSMTALPNGEMLLFGGESCDGESISVYNELFRWNVEKNEWKQIESLNTPPPRCSHQMVLYNDKLYMFGGEYATLDQFHHYKDFWEFNLKTNSWTEIRAIGDLPSARSGHRMTLWRNYIILFGGFYEAMREVRWYDDLFFYSLQEQRWTAVSFKPYVNKPKARSGLLMFLHSAEDTLYIFGGYSKQKEGSKQEGKIHEDMWSLPLKGCLGHKNSNIDFEKLSWQKISRKGDYPSPRCGSAAAIYKNKALVFGGVYDFEGPRHSMISTFYDDLFAFDMDRKRWYQLGLKNSKDMSKSSRKDKKSVVHDEVDNVDGDQECVDEEGAGDENDATPQLNSNMFGYIDESGEVVYLTTEDGEDDIGGTPELANTYTEIVKPVEEVDKQGVHDIVESVCKAIDSSLTVENASTEVKAVVEPPAKFDGDVVSYFERQSKPCPRINPCLMMRGNSLFVYGGATELGDTEVTLDDAWMLDINKRDAWRKILSGTMNSLVWKSAQDDLDSVSHCTGDSSDEDEDESDDDDEDGNESSDSSRNEDVRRRTIPKPKSQMTSRRAEMEMLRTNFDVTDEHRTPRNGESLRQFYARTCEHWTSEAINIFNAQQEAVGKPMSEKEFKREGFLLAEKRYGELLPLLTRLNELENEQKLEEEEAEEASSSKHRKPGKSLKR